MNIAELRLLALAILVLALAAESAAAGRAPVQTADRPLAAASDCRRATSDSRLICLSGSDCQREIGRILQACNSADLPSCTAARQDLRPTAWRGFPDRAPASARAPSSKSGIIAVVARRSAAPLPAKL